MLCLLILIHQFDYYFLPTRITDKFPKSAHRRVLRYHSSKPTTNPSAPRLTMQGLTLRALLMKVIITMALFESSSPFPPSGLAPEDELFEGIPSSKDLQRSSSKDDFELECSSGRGLKEGRFIELVELPLFALNLTFTHHAS